MMNRITLDSTHPLHTQLADILNQTAQDTDSARILCLLPNDYLIREVTHALVQSDFKGLLPTISTVNEWLNTAKDNTRTTLPQHQSLLLLANILDQHNHLYGEGSAWGLASNLLTLFNELTLENTPHDLSWDEFKTRLQTNTEHSWLNKEAYIVHTLWQAWHTQMMEDGWQDFATERARAFKLHVTQPHPYENIIYVAPFKSSTCEEQWLERLTEHTQVTYLQYDTPIELHTTERPIANSFSVEQHATVIANSAQRAYQNGLNPLLIVEDRKLSRRVQALLARKQIKVDDKSGWALSTTPAGACIEHWLSCIESDFAHHHLLDTLKSNCVDVESQLAEHNTTQAACVYRFEKDVVRHENISSTLARYQSALERRMARMGSEKNSMYDAIGTLLAHIENAAAPLQALFQNQNPVPLNVCINALLNSLTALGAYESLENDVAGAVIIKLLQDAQHDELNNILPDVTWFSFRAWLNHALEKTYFRPPVMERCISMVTYAQAYFMDADCYILCGVDDKTLPLKKPTLPFFSYQTQHDLGLENQDAFEARHKKVFYRVLHSNTPCLLTWQSQHDEERVGLSTWLLNALSSGQITLKDDAQAIADVQSCQNPSDQPSLTPYTKPNISDIGHALPNVFSASSHQTLINSPYDYFVGYILDLKPEEAVSDALQKSDYGHRVHRCLELFHQGILSGEHKLPEPLTEACKKDAQAILERIGQTVFFQDINHYFENNAWYALWKHIIPVYLNWEIKNQTQWRVKNTEQTIEYSLNEHITLKGRIDRTDTLDDTVALVDYKTGALPSKIDMNTGENVQLTTYAIAQEHVSALSYVNITPEMKSSTQDQDTLETLNIIEKVKVRLMEVHQSLLDGEAITAHCDEPGQTCRHPGLCRCAYWV